MITDRHGHCMLFWCILNNLLHTVGTFKYKMTFFSIVIAVEIWPMEKLVSIDIFFISQRFIIRSKIEKNWLFFAADTAEFTICFILFCLQKFACVNITQDIAKFTIDCIPQLKPRSYWSKSATRNISKQKTKSIYNQEDGSAPLHLDLI